MCDINKKLGSFLKNERISNSLSGAELAKKLNISQQQISRYENGKNNIPVKFLITYCNALHISPQKLMAHIFLTDETKKYL